MARGSSARWFGADGRNSHESLQNENSLPQGCPVRAGSIKSLYGQKKGFMKNLCGGGCARIGGFNQGLARIPWIGGQSAHRICGDRAAYHPAFDLGLDQLLVGELTGSFVPGLTPHSFSIRLRWSHFRILSVRRSCQQLRLRSPARTITTGRLRLSRRIY